MGRRSRHFSKDKIQNMKRCSTILFTSVQFSHSVMSNSLQPHESQHARPPCPSPTPGVLLKLMSTELGMPSNLLILCCPLLLLPSIFPSIRVFFCESVLHIRWPTYWSFSFSISPFNDHPGQISFILSIIYIYYKKIRFKFLFITQLRVYLVS